MARTTGDLHYHHARAEAEFRLAWGASHPAAREAHLVLAEHHRDRAAGGPGLLALLSASRH